MDDATRNNSAKMRSTIIQFKTINGAYYLVELQGTRSQATVCCFVISGYQSIPTYNTDYTFKMAIDLYRSLGSSVCTTVQLVAAALDLELNLIDLNFKEGDHLKPEYLKINPQHTIPAIVDDGFALSESRAIARYLVNKYGKDSTLYPTDVKLRALVDQRLDFELGTLCTRFAQFFYPQMAGAPADEALKKKFEDALKILDALLEGNVYAVGDKLTIADLSLVANVSTFEAFNTSLKEYPNILKWYELVKSTAPKYEEITEKALAHVRVKAAQLLSKQE
ncbi:glutathione S-transferase 1-1-like [Trichoplusia ni]|uniref:Glutathione S-transferase 1-1-like n=1 Tax=Trichoplusia ni TaxID=7111 RepID=A0A7E5VV92_TRINI|nr:glutathione S-transferase 1-1-like [Trichoplusia ni]